MAALRLGNLVTRLRVARVLPLPRGPAPYRAFAATPSPPKAAEPKVSAAAEAPATSSGGEALKGPQGPGKPQPKIHNQSVPGVMPGLTEAQKREVEQHNREFEQRHDRASPAEDDKVDKKFWQGA
ncbi:hypothetical protein GGS23DRAFT_319474 [Durotheca rogersii]|uniref:uncharacterized protein n=1 Tax=Durotheca rogersii TaxID=419775 RepID=UPI0022209E89|nr:uncharacterized protein GGS23DRAFT_319474 [Durotheca rogersii]KAI5859478.1 hypothetical protein GGS23DRAFT_319474 [Durotheca rogersii]